MRSEMRIPCQEPRRKGDPPYCHGPREKIPWHGHNGKGRQDDAQGCIGRTQERLQAYWSRDGSRSRENPTFGGKKRTAASSVKRAGARDKKSSLAPGLFTLKGGNTGVRNNHGQKPHEFFSQRQFQACHARDTLITKRRGR